MINPLPGTHRGHLWTCPSGCDQHTAAGETFGRIGQLRQVVSDEAVDLVDRATRCKLTGPDYLVQAKLFEEVQPTKTLHAGFLLALYEAEDIPTMVGLLSKTPYVGALETGLKGYTENSDLMGFEMELDRYILNAVVKFGVKHTLTAGPVMRYMISKEFEVRNIKVVARGIYEQLQSKRINSMLVWEVPQS